MIKIDRILTALLIKNQWKKFKNYTELISIHRPLNRTLLKRDHKIN